MKKFNSKKFIEEIQKNYKTEYKGYHIHPVFNYSNGKSDWQIFHKYAEHGEMIHKKTYNEVKQYIDEIE